MQIVIDISEKEYNYYRDASNFFGYSKLREIILNGTSLPKGHRDSVIPYMLHKELNCPLDECIKAYDKVIEYLRNKARVKG